MKAYWLVPNTVMGRGWTVLFDGVDGSQTPGAFQAVDIRHVHQLQHQVDGLIVQKNSLKKKIAELKDEILFLEKNHAGFR